MPRPDETMISSNQLHLPFADAAKTARVHAAGTKVVCADCGRTLTMAEARASMWGCCIDCENERLGDVVAG